MSFVDPGNKNCVEALNELVFALSEGFFSRYQDDHHTLFVRTLISV